MKKRYIIIVILVFIILFFSIFIFSNKSSIDPVFKYSEKEQGVYVFYVKEDEVFGINMEKNYETQEEKIHCLFSYLTNLSNYAPLTYKSCVGVNTLLLDYTISDTSITLNLSSNFLCNSDEDIRYALSCIYETYKINGYEFVYVRVDGYDNNYLANVNLNSTYESICNLKVIDTSDSKVIKVYKMIDEDILSFSNILTSKKDINNFIIENIIKDSEYDILYENNIITLVDVKSDEIIIYFKDLIYDYETLKECISINFPNKDISLKIA